MSVFHDLRTSRFTKFLLIHAVVSLAAAAILVSKYAHLHEPAFRPYFLAFTQTFLKSFAGAFMSLLLLNNALFNGFAGTGEMTVFSHTIPLPLAAGLLGLGAFFFVIWGMIMYRAKTMYLAFIISSCLFMASSYIFFVEMPNYSKAAIGQPIVIQPDK